MSRRLSVAAAALLSVGAFSGCALSSPGGAQATLKPTLELRQVDGGTVAFQSGQPVPDFGSGTRPRVDLDRGWRFQPAALDTTLTMGDRKTVMNGLRVEAGSRIQPAYDDAAWRPIDVPGDFNPPPESHVAGGYYRLRFAVPAAFPAHASLRFGSVAYVADVWLNGRYLGYHEGGNTPFALDPQDALQRGAENVLTLRVDLPELGTRLDIVPWGLTDWWVYGGITGDVWLEGEPDLSVVRADVVPHLDGADVRAVLWNRGPKASNVDVRIEVLPVAVTPQNLVQADPAALVAADRPPVFETTIPLGSIDGGGVKLVATAFGMRDADLWSPPRPALYVLRVSTSVDTALTDHLDTTFGLRTIQVERTRPRLLLNGQAVAFHGVAMHDERIAPAGEGRPAGGPATDVQDFLDQVEQAGAVNADLIRADHTPPNPLLLMLADRLGVAVWEEIPLYHFTPESFQATMQRGVPQQMLAEMALRDFNHPSVLFHGFANESVGQVERVATLTALRDLDRRLDGTRLDGQAASGYDPEDPSSSPLDVAGVTFYYGVFYGGALEPQEMLRALSRMHATYPRKPLMVLEFGRWADSPAEEPEQKRVFDVTYSAFSQVLGTDLNGYLGSTVWWSLNDYWTERPGIQIEHFGLFRPDGSPRPVQAAVAAAYATSPNPPGVLGQKPVVSGGQAVSLGEQARHPEGLAALVAYGLAIPTVALVSLIALLVWPGRSTRRARAA